jgi:hypothetical protein
MLPFDSEIFPSMSRSSISRHVQDLPDYMSPSDSGPLALHQAMADPISEACEPSTSICIADEKKQEEVGTWSFRYDFKHAREDV